MTPRAQAGDGAFVANIMGNANEYVSLFSRAIDELLPARELGLDEDADVWDVLEAHRRQQAELAAVAAGGGAGPDPKVGFPPSLFRR